MMTKVLKVWMFSLAVVLFMAGPFAMAQDAAGLELDSAAAAAAAKEAGRDAMSFGRIVTNSGFMGIMLWLALGACSVAGFALIVDSFITIREKKIVPGPFVAKVREAMEQGDVMKAVKHCEEEPGPLSAILTAGFSNVQEGFEAIQEAVGVAADLESEKLLQRVTYLNVVANLAPMLGLLGTVQGMIFAFATLGTQSAGAAQQSMLALNIAQALYTTAGGLLAAVPALAFFYYFRNRATKITLGMEALTLDLIKVLRNVEVVSE
ncbi:MAG TPA: MotA/TolQ/ExbB proton channel family protein [Kiritimatiellia bacterium]|nr:MotA/TolQ/ExbB proton channel family protein [Kiritimatiellia bacterium]